ncbi:MAG: alpha/beta fold hydrolase [Candidatus Kapaibacterium sp.]
MKKLLLILLLFSIAGCSKDVTEIEKKSVVNDTSINKENVDIYTSDGLKLSANYIYKTDKTKQLLVILIHQYRSNKEEWSSSFVDSLINKGYKVIAYDIRSHGKSDKANVELSELLSNPEQAPKDIDAVIKWAKMQTSIDSNRIAVVGTSIGGSLGIYARINSGVKSIVSVSSGKSTFEAFTGYDERKMSMARPIPRIKNVMFISGNKDKNIAEEERSIYENYLDEPKELQIYESDKHGKYLIEEFPQINDLIINWLNKTL